jgi:hypothetical protein
MILDKKTPAGEEDRRAFLFTKPDWEEECPVR